MLSEELKITARLAQLELSREEFDRFEAAVMLMLDYFDRMGNCDVSDLPPTAQLADNNRLRRDSVREETKALLDNAPERDDRFIVIPNVL